MATHDYGRRIAPKPLGFTASVLDVVEAMTAYNGARLREACELFAEKIARAEVTIGWTLSGALTPGGYHLSCLIPLAEAGLVDWIVSTGANLYHDLHYAMGFAIYQSGCTHWDDERLRRERMIRVYDLLFDEEALFEADAFFRRVAAQPELQGTMGTAEFYHHCGQIIQQERKSPTSPFHTKYPTILETCYRLGIPIYTSSPGDSSIGMNLAAARLLGETTLTIDPAIDLNETTALVYAAKQDGGKSAIVILGGGSPKNFALQTEPQIQQILNLEGAGHDYFLQITDARVDTGGLSGATPSEAVTWGKIDPEQLPNTVVVYTDTTIALPILTAYAFTMCEARSHRQLYDRRLELVEQLRRHASARLTEV